MGGSSDAAFVVVALRATRAAVRTSDAGVVAVVVVGR